jgi:predicted nucleic-acid-binding protein
VAKALRAYAEGRADFSDYLIGARSRAKGARTTYTFDGKLKNREGFTYLR